MGEGRGGVCLGVFHGTKSESSGEMLEKGIASAPEVEVTTFQTVCERSKSTRLRGTKDDLIDKDLTTLYVWRNLDWRGHQPQPTLASPPKSV